MDKDKITFVDGSHPRLGILTARIPTYHSLDVDKIQTIEDIKLVLKYLDLHVADTHEDFSKVKHLLKIEKE